MSAVPVEGDAAVGVVDAVVPLGGVDAVVPPPAPDDVLAGYLELLREAAERAVRGYRRTWEAADRAGLTPDLQAVAAVGFRPAAEPGAAEPPTGGLFPGLDVSVAVEALVAAAWWAAADPQLAVVLGCLHDDATRRRPSLAVLRLMLAPYGITIPLALPADSGPVADGLLQPAPDADAPVRLTPTAALLLAGWRPVPRSSGDDRAIPPRLREPVARTAAVLAAGPAVTVRCDDPDDGWVLARAVAHRLGRVVEAVGESGVPGDPTRSGEPRLSTGRSAAELRLLDALGLVLPTGTGEDATTRLRLALAGAACAPGRQVVDVPAVDQAQVHRAWRLALAACGLDPREAGALAARMRLPEQTIAALEATARDAAAVDRRHVTVADLHAAVRRHPQHRLEGLARLLPPSVTLDDLVLSRATLAGLADVLAHARYGGAVTADLPGVRGRAVVALFHGPSGTGKTAATEALAAALDRDLWVADLAQVVSKWLGETSRNLDRLLTEAARCGAVLLFDEAEGLFGRRAEVSDARDRYANLEIDHLLQRVELHEGLVVLTSNRPAALDEGFQRRVRIAVRFDLPDHAARLALWTGLLPSDLLAPGADLDAVAGAELSAAAVRAAAIGARVFAAADDTAVDTEHLHRAVRRELEKNGRTWTPPQRAASQRPASRDRTPTAPTPGSAGVPVDRRESR